MNIPYIIVCIAIDAIIVVISALVGTELFIRPSEEFGPAVKTYSFHSVTF